MTCTCRAYWNLGDICFRGDKPYFHLDQNEILVCGKKMISFFWQLSGTREREKKLLDHSLLLTKSIWGREREKSKWEGFVPYFEISSRVHPREQCFLALLILEELALGIEKVTVTLSS